VNRAALEGFQLSIFNEFQPFGMNSPTLFLYGGQLCSAEDMNEVLKSF
jgi:hypothetical protein